MAQILWTPQASTELEDILYFIRVNGDRPLTAQRLGEELIEIIGQLTEGSLKGHSHPATPAEWLYYQFKRWLIFYQPHPKGIEIMRIIDGARDLPREFGGEC